MHRAYLSSGLDKNPRERNYRVLFLTFSILITLMKKHTCILDYFHSFIWKIQKNDITQKTSNMQSIPIFFTGLQHMSRLWTKKICIKPPLKHLPIVSTLTFSVMTLEFILLPLVSHFPFWRSHVTCYVIAYESLLFCKLCFPCHFCVVLLFKGCYHLSQFLCWPFLRV